jgi:hypothetical protein
MFSSSYLRQQITLLQIMLSVANSLRPMALFDHATCLCYGSYLSVQPLIGNVTCLLFFAAGSSIQLAQSR